MAIRRALQLGFAAALLVYWTGLAAGIGSYWFTHGLFLLLLVAALALLYARVLWVREERSAWALLALGFTSWTTGFFFHLGGEAVGRPWASPGPVDAFWLPVYPFAMAALFQLGRQLRGVGAVPLADILTITLVMAGAVTVVALPPLLAADGMGGLGRGVVVAYQVGDSILASIVVVALAVAGRQAGNAWILLAVAILIIGIGDTAWTLRAAATGPVPGMVASNAVYPLALALVAAAAWQPPRDRSASLAGAEIRVHAALMLAVIVGIALLAANEWIAVPAVSVVLVALGLAGAMHRLWRVMLRILRTSRSAARDREQVDAVRKALAAGELTLHYQPLIALETGAVHGVEALLRWEARRPEEFLPVVERSDLMRAVTDHVLERALSDLSHWRAAGHDIGVSVNLAAANLSEIDLPERVASALLRHGTPARRLTLEITETAAVCADAIPDRVVAALDAVGVGLSIDDFGTGHSSLVRIARFPISEIKIDRSFVVGMKQAKLPIVATSIALARGLGLRVVAEGIEDGETVAALRTLGCEIGQGYYFSRPIPADAMTRWLAATTATDAAGAGARDGMVPPSDAVPGVGAAWTMRSA